MCILCVCECVCQKIFSSNAKSVTCNIQSLEIAEGINKANGRRETTTKNSSWNWVNLSDPVE